MFRVFAIGWQALSYAMETGRLSNPGRKGGRMTSQLGSARVIPAIRSACMMPASCVVLEMMSFNRRHKIDYTALQSAIAALDSLPKPKAGLSTRNGLSLPTRIFLLSAAIRCGRLYIDSNINDLSQTILTKCERHKTEEAGPVMSVWKTRQFRWMS
jgi:hypothetical protein